MKMQSAGYELEPSMMQMARAIKKQCMRYPTYSDCYRCECFDKFEGECKLGEPAGWPIDEEEGEE